MGLLAGLAIGKAWERYKLRDGKWIDRRRARDSHHYVLGLNFLVSNQIDLAIEELKAEDENVADAEVVSASALDDRQKERLAGALRKRLRRDVRLTCSVDPTLNIDPTRAGVEPEGRGAREGGSVGVRPRGVGGPVDPVRSRGQDGHRSLAGQFHRRGEGELLAPPPLPATEHVHRRLSAGDHRDRVSRGKRLRGLPQPGAERSGALPRLSGKEAGQEDDRDGARVPLPRDPQRRRVHRRPVRPDERRDCSEERGIVRFRACEAPVPRPGRAGIRAGYALGRSYGAR